MGFSFNRISDFFVVLVLFVVQEVLHECGFSELRASRAKKDRLILIGFDLLIQHACRFFCSCIHCTRKSKSKEKKRKKRLKELWPLSADRILLLTVVCKIESTKPILFSK